MQLVLTIIIGLPAWKGIKGVFIVNVINKLIKKEKYNSFYILFTLLKPVTRLH